MGFSTKQVHAGVVPDPVSGSILTPIYQSTTFVQESVDQYLVEGLLVLAQRQPDRARARAQARGARERRRLHVLFDGHGGGAGRVPGDASAGDHAVISDVAYGGTYRLATKIYSRFGVEFTFADSSNPESVRKALRDNTKLIFTETPANPTLKLGDIAAISKIAKERKILHAVDNTFLTPYYQRPLELGANISVHSTTKYFDGHNATVGGAVIVDSEELDKKMRFVQNATGVIMSPFVAWLTLQGTKTLSIRHRAPVGQRAERSRSSSSRIRRSPRSATRASRASRSTRSRNAKRAASVRCCGSKCRAASRRARSSWTP